MKAIEVKDVVITYRPLNKVSVKNSLFHGEKKPQPFVAVDHVSFNVEKGEIVGIIGRNGSGKSTLLKALAGIFSPDEGSIDLGGQSIGLLAIGAGFMPEMTGRKNIYISGLLMGFTKEEIAAKEDSIIEFSEVGGFIDMPVKTYSSGMYSKLAFAITSTLETDILLIDEVLSVGDEHFKAKSEKRMRELIQNKDRTVLIVSHTLPIIEELCSTTIWMNKGKIMAQGKTAEVVHDYKHAVHTGMI